MEADISIVDALVVSGLYATATHQRAPQDAEKAYKTESVKPDTGTKVTAQQPSPTRTRMPLYAGRRDLADSAGY